ncbi:hypothetical protein GS501_02145 [Saccharibacter sp. 17.LH.SD]|uniref:hypothetical protein n=1 Tax=Saccharibacter sp. 17.LH.SD TaxID=2689393 RepID=UPI00136DC656|nr:hypothetical protein [Saccharibacter sp. 17.LH.SD]MXV43853.1 hypothetical protein [Saccharibacter sp. 17.LH.SD]
MSAFGKLWKRAPLWRTCLVIGIGGIGMACFFPTPSIKHYAPWLPGSPQKFSDTPPPNTSPSDGAPTPFTHVELPDLNATIQNHISLAGHTLPLPKGEWHPVLKAQAMSDIPYSLIALMRTDHGAVTGFIIAQAVQQPLPQISPDEMLTPCHDDRNYLTKLQITPSNVDCIFLGNVILPQSNMPAISFAEAALKHTQTSGFPLPPFMINADWIHANLIAPNQWTAVEEETFIAPLDPDTHQLLAPLGSWSKETLSRHPAAQNFISASRQWLPLWQKALQQTYDNTLPSGSLSSAALKDPAAPQ